MSITKWYEIICNSCGCANHYLGSIKSAEVQYIDGGGMVKNKKHYCSKDCYKDNNEQIPKSEN